MPTSRSGALCAGSCGARVCCSVSGADGKAGPDAGKLACADAAGFLGSSAGAVTGFSGTPAGRGAGPAENQPDTGGTGPDEGRSRAGATGATGRGIAAPRAARAMPAGVALWPSADLAGASGITTGSRAASSCFCASVSTGCRGSGAASATGPAPLCGAPACAGGVTCPSRGLSSRTREKSALGSTLEGALCAAESRSPNVSPRMASLTSVRTASATAGSFWKRTSSLLGCTFTSTC